MKAIITHTTNCICHMPLQASTRLQTLRTTPWGCWWGFWIIFTIAVAPNYAAAAENTSEASEKKSSIQTQPQKISVTNLFDSRTINAEVQLGVVGWNSSKLTSRLVSRIQVGLLHAKDPFFTSLDLGVDIGGLRTVAIGLHCGISHFINGFFAQAFYAMALDGTSILGGAVGWSLIGVEGQIAPAEDSERLLLFKLRIPFGIGMYGKHKMGRDVQVHTRSPK